MNYLYLFLLSLLNTQNSAKKTENINNITINRVENNLSSNNNFDTDKNVILGFLTEWRPGGEFPLIPREYNIIGIVFSPKEYGEPNLSPGYLSEEDTMNGIKTLKNEGRMALMTIGGSDTYISINNEDKEQFKSDLIYSLDKYGFDGVILDLESDSMTAGDNQEVIPEVLKEVKQYYRERGKNFIIAMAPEFPTLRNGNAPYIPYLNALEGEFDFIFPQYYNQDGDGIWTDVGFISQDNDEKKSLFLYYLTDALINGTQGFISIPPNKLAFGIPVSRDAAFNGFVEDPNDVKYALERLASEGKKTRGIMGWSINQDMEQNFDFINKYAPIVYGIE